MKKELIPIVASYLGCICSYKLHCYTLGNFTKSRLFSVDLFRNEVLENAVSNFKLHLRKPDQITNEELRVLSGLICGVEYEVENEMGTRFVKDSDLDVIVWITSEEIALGECYGSNYAKTTNYLRSIGICVDQCLVDEGLVEWVGND
jgi:hypothetical protein